MIIKNQQNSKLAEEHFVTWLITQTNSHGSFYLERVSRQYARYLRTQPPKLIIPLSQEERNVYACKTVESFERLYKVFLSAPNFKEVNLQGHQSFSAGLSAYRRYVRYIDENGEPEMHEQEIAVASVETLSEPLSSVEPQRVVFSNPQVCKRTNPYSCEIGFMDVPIRGTWIDLFVDVVELFLKIKQEQIERYIFKSGRPLLMDKPLPNLNCKTLTNGKVILVNYGIGTIVQLIGKICSACDVDLNDVIITCVPKSGTGGETIVKYSEESSRFAQQDVRNAFRTWLIEQHPEWSDNTVSMHCSDAYYLYNRNRGISLEEALTTDDGLQRAYDAIEQFYTANPTKTNTPSGSARGYLRSLRMLKEFLTDKFPDLLRNGGNAAIADAVVPDALIEALNHTYSTGFRFETTYVNLLSSVSGVEIDEKMQSALKRLMFRRDDGIYFLFATVTDAVTRKDIVDFADIYLEEYGCFEIPEFYKLYAEKVNPVCIRNADDFESFYEQIGKSGVRCVQAPYVGNRIARYSNGSVWGTFKEVAAKIVAVISEEYYGSCNEDDLHTKFCAFSTDLLGKIIKQCAADDLIRVEINGSVCYQTYEALGLPENFSEQLAEVVERMDEIGLTIYRDALHTALSLKIGVNFMAEFNLPDWDTFQRLVAAFYKVEPRREWKHYIFGEVTQ